MLDLPKNLVVIESSNSDGPREDFFIEKLLTFVKKLELLKVSGSRNKVVDPQILPKNFLDLKVTKSNVSIGFVKMSYWCIEKINHYIFLPHFSNITQFLFLIFLTDSIPA